MFTKSRLALVIGAALATTSAVAETQTADEHLVVEGREFGYKADTNRTAMRMEMTQLETPGQVAVIDETVIDEQRASTLGEVLKNDASISSGSTDRNRERFSLRGFSVDGILRDGRQHWSHYRQPVELLERVEVLKGPSGLLYGSSQPGGLVNMVSKKPTAKPQAKLSQDIGSNNRSRSVLDVSGALNEEETLRARTTLSKESYSSYREYGDGTKPQTDRFVGGLVLEWDVNENVTVSAHYDRTEDDGSVDSGALVNMANGKPVLGDKHIWDAQWSNIDNTVENYGFDIDAQVTDNIRVNTGFNRQDFRRQDVESFPNFSKYESEGVIIHGGSDRRDNWVFDTAYFDVTSDFSLFGTENTLLIGANHLHNTYDQVNYSFESVEVPPGSTVPNPEYSGDPRTSSSSYRTWGTYIQNMMTINDQWQVLAGLRYDEKRDDITESHVSPKLGVIYHPASNGSIYVQYSESFNPQGEVTSENAANQGEKLTAERGVSYEIGTKWELFDQRLYLSGALFDITKKDVKLNVDYHDPSNSDIDHIVTQDGEQRHKGAEIMAQGFVTNKLSLTASAMYLDAEILKHETLSGKRPVDVPEFSASLWSKYKIQNNTDLNLGVVYEGERYGDAANTFKKDGYARVDLGVAYTHNYDKDLDITVRFNVNNLFDTDYLAGGGSTSNVPEGTASKVTLGERRSYMATVQFNF